MTKDVLKFATQCADEGQKVALITVTAITGSSPATPGQMIAVLADGSISGTVGGGASEHKIITRAVEAIRSNEDVFKLFIDHAETGMTCGGSMEVVGNIIGNQPGICIFGGGHISQSLAAIAHHAGFAVSIVEDRVELNHHFEFANFILSKAGEHDTHIPPLQADYAVICTRGHSTDIDALRYCLKNDFKYIGMIGSKKKVSEVYTTLINEGVDKTKIDSIYAPIGLDIAGTSPGEIAVAIIAEILLIKNNGKLTHKRLL